MTDTDTVEPLARHLPEAMRPFCYDSAKASAAARKRHELQRLRSEPPKPLPAQQAQPQIDERLPLITEQIALTRVTLLGKLEPHHRAALLRALCDLLDQQRILRGEPLPGSRHPGRERDERRQPVMGCLGPSSSPDVAPAPPARPIGWEYDDPAACGVPAPNQPPNTTTGSVTS